MFKNYLKITFRNLVKDKWFSLINVVGLTIGIATSLLVNIYITSELSYDDFHKDSDRIYRVTKSSSTANGVEHESAIPYPLINALKNDFTQFEISTQVHLDDKPLAMVNDEKLLIDRVVFADSNFFDVFDFKVVQGNPKKTLSVPNGALLSKSLATRLFGNENPIGQKIKLRNLIDVEVEGIFEDVAPYSHLKFDMLVSYPSFSSEYLIDLPIDSWTMSAKGYAYVKLKTGIEPSDLEMPFTKMVDKYYTEDDSKARTYQLQPLKDIRFDHKWNKAAIDTGSLIILGIIGAFILIIGCVNFINLSTSMAAKKSKEVGVRKTLGASKRQLIIQNLSDTFITTLVSGLLAIGFCERLIPLFNQYFDKQLEVNLLETSLFAFAIILLVTLLSGIYPALVLSRYSAIKALKSNLHSQSSSSLFLRKGLIIVQFFISQVLIIATIVIANQMDYFKSKPLGFDKEAVINIDIPENDEVTLEKLRGRLMSNGYINSVSFSLAPPLSESNFDTEFYLTETGLDDQHKVFIKPVDYHYKDTYGIKVKYGRWFEPSEEKSVRKMMAERKFKEDVMSYVINETGARKLGFNDPQEAVGKYITTGFYDINGPIIGVVADFHGSSFRDEISPVIMLHLPMFYYAAGIKISMQDGQKAIAHLQKVHEDLFPNNIFEYKFMDEEIEAMYVAEERTFFMISIFSGLSIFISCLGLLGMITFMVSQRVKEIGIRKVLGATVESIMLLFSREFTGLVLIAFVLSAPVAWYFMSSWLSDFAYKIDMEIWFFAVSILISMIITIMTIGYQALRAAVSNPVDSLKDE